MNPKRWQYGLFLATVLSLVLAAPALAAQPPVGLGTAGSFAVLAGSTVTNTGPSVINGDLGVHPGTAVTGFPPGTVNGTIHAADAVAAQAQSDTTAAYNDAAGRTPAVSVAGDLGGLTLTPGVYKSTSSIGLTGDLTLDAQGDPNAVFIFQIGSTLTTASASRVVLLNGANHCNVFWQVGSSATLGTNTTFRGTILALTSITLNTGATALGRMLARNGAVTLDDNRITRGDCASLPADDTGGGAPTDGGSPGTTAPDDGSTLGGTAPGTEVARGTGTAIFTTGPRIRPHRCVNGFRAIIRGLRIRRVIFYLDGRRIATRRSAPFSVRIPRQRGGLHRVRARVTFTDATRAANLSLRYRACAAARRVPRFTG